MDGQAVKDMLERYTAGGCRAAAAACGAAAFDGCAEARLRAGKPMAIRGAGFERYIGPGGLCAAGAAYRPTERDLADCLDLMSGHSLYALAEEVRGGFITLPGGHRVGLAGKAVVEGGAVKLIKQVSGLNIRVCRAVPGCGEAVFPFIYGKDGGVKHTLVVSPPGAGKTTLLRALARRLSDAGVNVAVVDERSELAGGGALDLGERTDVLDGCPKAAGMMMAIRSLGPQALAADELGGERDADAALEAAAAGVAVLCSAHGRGVEDLWRKPSLRRLMEGGVFERFVELSARRGAGTVEAVYDAAMQPLYRAGDGVALA